MKRVKGIRIPLFSTSAHPYSSFLKKVGLIILVALVAVLPTAVFADSGSVIYVLDPNAIVQGQSDVQTSLPSAFTGAIVNNYLGANRFYTNGITGQGTITANVEAGKIWNGHEALTQVTNFVAPDDSLNEYDRHATWVGMMIGGRQGGSVPGTYQTGIAMGTDLRSGAMANAWYGSAYSRSFDFSAGAFVDTYKAFFGTANVINSSWNFTDTTGQEDLTIALDGFSSASPTTTFVASSGNSGSNPNTVGGPASGYNRISVGALQNDGANNYSSIAGFSSRGPQDYNDPVHKTVPGVRAAVDIVAPGTDLTSAFYGGQEGGNGPSLPGSVNSGGPNYCTWGLAGTSFAAPIVAGGASLLNSASITDALPATSRDARVIKAVLLNSADKLTGWNNGQTTVNNVVTTTQSLDWTLGAGRMNLNKAYDQYLSGTEDVPGLGGDSISALGWDNGAISLLGHNDYQFSQKLKGGTTMDVTLSWFRDRRIDTDALFVYDEGFANLDLEVWDVNTQLLIATSHSLYNSVEELHFTLPNDDNYFLRVTYPNQMFGPPVQEVYGLAWSATAVVPEPGTLVLIAAAGGCFLGYTLMRKRA
ncbi:MAG: S8 family serine peptidase [Planctomycetota bacterium]